MGANLVELVGIAKLHTEGIPAGFGVCRQPFANLIERFFRPGITSRNQHKRRVGTRVDGGFDPVNDYRQRRDGEILRRRAVFVDQAILETNRRRAGTLVGFYRSGECFRTLDKIVPAVDDQRDICLLPRSVPTRWATCVIARRLRSGRQKFL